MKRVPVGIGEERHVADAGIKGLRRELDAALLSAAALGDIVNVQRDRIWVDRMHETHLLGVEHAERQVARLELGIVAVLEVDRPGRPTVWP